MPYTVESGLLSRSQDSGLWFIHTAYLGYTVALVESLQKWTYNLSWTNELLRPHIPGLLSSLESLKGVTNPVNGAGSCS